MTLLPPFPVLYEDNHLLVINKPAMLPTAGVTDDKPSLLKLAQRYIGSKYNKPGAVYLGVVSRLDAPVSGVVVVARTSKAAKRLTEQFRSRAVEKRYWAVVPGPIVPSRDRCVDWLRKDESRRRVVVCRPDHPDGKEAILEYETVRQLGNMCLLQIKLLTGRKHQIRVQLADRDCPILGDKKYGSDRRFPRGIALHSRCLCFEHPVRHEALEFTAEIPESWQQWKT